jgi:hypothetical protein
VDAKSSLRLVGAALLATLVAPGLLAASCARASPPMAPSPDGEPERHGDGDTSSQPAPSAMSLLAVSDGPHLLAEKATRVVLATGAAGLVAADLSDLRDRRLHLVLRDLAADRPPGVLYHLYLDLAEGEEPRDDDPRYVGDLNFFGVETGGATAEVRSYDVTPLAGRLAAAAREGRPLAVTFRSADRAAAAPRIGRVELLLR